MAAVNERLRVDVAGTNKRACGRLAVPRSVVLKTWGGLLEGEGGLPNDWIDVPGVLVGMPPFEARDAG
ncbi:hypothetical protein OH77DRAFT_1416886 [Trametes cingulata]|nr:hypothetical protein OH77DRAFT_1416886 [Trametes cingulata]